MQFQWSFHDEEEDERPTCGTAVDVAGLGDVDVTVHVDPERVTAWRKKTVPAPGPTVDELLRQKFSGLPAGASIDLTEDLFQELVAHLPKQADPAELVAPEQLAALTRAVEGGDDLRRAIEGALVLDGRDDARPITVRELVVYRRSAGRDAIGVIAGTSDDDEHLLGAIVDGMTVLRLTDDQEIRSAGPRPRLPPRTLRR